jgi:hypothetical protein
VTPVKIKIKEVKAKKSFHNPTSPIYKTYPIRIVKGNLTFLNNPFNMAKIHVKLPPHLSPSGQWGEVYGYVTSLSHFQV